jgi:hypothetical protein
MFGQQISLRICSCLESLDTEDPPSIVGPIWGLRTEQTLLSPWSYLGPLNIKNSNSENVVMNSAAVLAFSSDFSVATY